MLCNLRISIDEDALSFRNSVIMLSHLAGGSWIVRWMPLRTQPKISYLVSHAPSSSNFFGEMAGPMTLPVTLGGGKILVMAVNIHRVRRFNSFLLVH